MTTEIRAPASEHVLLGNRVGSATTPVPWTNIRLDEIEDAKGFPYAE
jgi:hypothetical protein